MSHLLPLPEPDAAAAAPVARAVGERIDKRMLRGDEKSAITSEQEAALTAWALLLPDVKAPEVYAATNFFDDANTGERNQRLLNNLVRTRREKKAGDAAALDAALTRGLTRFTLFEAGGRGDSGGKRLLSEEQLQLAAAKQKVVVADARRQGEERQAARLAEMEREAAAAAQSADAATAAAGSSSSTSAAAAKTLQSLSHQGKEGEGEDEEQMQQNRIEQEEFFSANEHLRPPDAATGQE